MKEGDIMGGKELDSLEIAFYKRGFEEGKAEGEEERNFQNKIKKLELEIEQLKSSI